MDLKLVLTGWTWCCDGDLLDGAPVGRPFQRQQSLAIDVAVRLFKMSRLIADEARLLICAVASPFMWLVDALVVKITSPVVSKNTLILRNAKMDAVGAGALPCPAKNFLSLACGVFF